MNGASNVTDTVARRAARDANPTHARSPARAAWRAGVASALVVLVSAACATLPSPTTAAAATTAASAPRQAARAPSAPARLEYFRRADSRAPFSPAVRVGDVIYLSGQVGAAPDGSIPPGIEAQARAAMDNLAAAAKLAGASLDDVFKCTVMLEDMAQWAAFNRVYLGYFKPERLPARSAFGVDGLALGATVEVECLALAPSVGGKR